MVQFVPRLLIATLAVLAIAPPMAIAQNTTNSAKDDSSVGQELFKLGKYERAIHWLQVQIQQSQNSPLVTAGLRNNLALAYAKSGQWAQANQAIAKSFQDLEGYQGEGVTRLKAQLLRTKGQLELKQGNAEAALATWQQAANLFSQIQDSASFLQSRLDQAEAMQRLGFYRRSIVLLTDLATDLQQQPPSEAQVIQLRSLGSALQDAGDLEQAQTLLQQSIRLAQTLNDREAIAQGWLALGNLRASESRHNEALTHYEQAIFVSDQASTQVQAKLNGLRSQIGLQQANSLPNQLPSLRQQIQALPLSQSQIQAQLHLAKSLQLYNQDTQNPVSTLTLGQILATAQQQARQLGDRALESTALGELGHLYEQTGQYQDAQKLTQSALDVVDPQSNGDIVYRWQWQLGRLFRHQGDRPQAIQFYQAALKTLADIRQDVSSLNQEAQFGFQEQVEPLYREFVALLLTGNTIPTQNLELARQTMESLQLAELDNYFRSACLDVIPVLVEEVDPQAAIIYPIVLDDKLAVITRLPNEPLHLNVSTVDQATLEQNITRLQLALGQDNDWRFRQITQDLYDWILRPIAPELEHKQVKTLVFIPDGLLRNIPMGVLHNGDRFLVEEFAIATTPGLQLLQAGNKTNAQSNVLIAGLTEARQGQPGIPGVEKEVASIAARLKTRTLLNQDFTQQRLTQTIQNRPFSILHLATHGQFSSNERNTYLITWDEKLDTHQLRTLLQNKELRYQTSLELLVLSACETAKGDRQSGLGLAGLATRSGAKTTVATLWQVNDQVTAIFMDAFYEALSQNKVTKAQALQYAQLKLLRDPDFGQHPYYWGAYTMIGNWQ